MEEKKRCESYLPLHVKEKISKGKQLQTDSFISICPEIKIIRPCVRISNEFVANIVTFEKTI